MVVLDKVTDLLLFFGKLLVVGGVGKGQDQGLWCQEPAGVREVGVLGRTALTAGLFPTGVLSFFFFSGRIKGTFENPDLNYYWLPIMVSDTSLCPTHIPGGA